MKTKDLVRIKEYAIFGTIVDIVKYSKINSIFVKDFDGFISEFTEEELEKVEYYDMLKELIFAKDYDQHKHVSISKNGITLDGLKLPPNKAVELAKDILEFYHSV
jgi:hypothetical protein